MNLHSNARLTLRSRADLVEAVTKEGLTLKRAAARFRVSERTAAKWLGRFRREGMAGLQDRSSRPHLHPKTTSEAQVAVVLALRQMRLPGFQIAKYSDLSRATVSRILTRHGLAKLSDLDPPPPAIRYQREHPGDLLHIDIKKLGRIVRPGHRVTGNKRDHFPGAGWEFVHVAIDDASRMAYAKIMPDEKIDSVTEFLREALAHFASFGIRVRQLMSDNGPAYRSRPVATFLQKLGIEHIFTRPYTPRTNGKAERFIQTSLREWAYAAVYQNSAHRQQHLQPWLHRYNWHRPHTALKLKTPVQSLNLPMNNVLRLHKSKSKRTLVERAFSMVWLCVERLKNKTPAPRGGTGVAMNYHPPMVIQKPSRFCAGAIPRRPRHPQKWPSRPRCRAREWARRGRR